MPKKDNAVETVDAEVVETALAVVQAGGALVSAEEQARLEAAELAALMGEDAGDGFENVTAADVAIPFLKLLQKGSPECEEGGQAFMEAAKPGMLLDSVTRGLVDIRDTQKKYALVIPVSYVKVISEWRPNQGGKVKDHPFSQALLESCTRKETPDGGSILVNDDGNVMEETAKYHVLLVSEDGSVHWAIMALSGSKLGSSKKWMNLISGKKDPKTGKDAALYSFIYRVSSFLDTSKRSGKTYQNLRFEDHAKVTDLATYKAAKKFRADVQAGTVKEAPEGPVDGAVDPNEPAF